MIEEDVEDDMTCFIDTNVNAFRVEVLFLKKDMHKPPIVLEVDVVSHKGDLWTIFIDGACYKEGSGVGILLISPKGTKYKFSFTLCFP